MALILFIISVFLFTSVGALSSPSEKHIGIRPELSNNSYAHRSAIESGIEVSHQSIMLFVFTFCVLIVFQLILSYMNLSKQKDQDSFHRKGSWRFCPKNDSRRHTTVSISRRITYKISSAIKILGKARTKQI